MGKSASAPPPVDYVGAAKAQGAANKEAAIASATLSNPNMITPTGTRTVSYAKQYQSPEITNPNIDISDAAWNAYATSKGLTPSAPSQGLPFSRQALGIGQNNAYDTAKKDWMASQQSQLDKYKQSVADREANALMVPTITDKLTPEAQKAFEAQQRVDLALSNLGEQATGTVQKTMSTPFDYTGPGVQTKLDMANAPKMPVNAGTTGQEAVMKRLQPQLQQERDQLQTQLANQGITPGSQAYENAMTDQNQRENDLLSQAAVQGINIDMAGRTQALNEALQSGQFGNTADQQEFARQLGLYNLPLNQVAALMSGSQIQMPQFQGYTGANVQATPLFQGVQAQDQSNLARYNAEQAGSNALTGGLFGMLGTGLGGFAGTETGANAIKGIFSDRRLKRNIEKIGSLDSGLNLYKYKYNWDDTPQIGVMSDEVRKVFPEAVFVADNGYDMVDYSKLV